MKQLSIILAILGMTASVAFGGTGDTHLVCGFPHQQNSLSIEFDGPRFVDFLNFGITEQEIQNLLFDNEKGGEAYAGAIRGFLTMGSCKKGFGDVLASCHNDDAFLSYEFTRHEKLSEDYSQRVTYSRHLEIKDISIVVKKVNEQARLDVKMTFSHFTAQDETFEISRVLGNIDQGPGSCRYTNGKPQQINF